MSFLAAKQPSAGAADPQRQTTYQEGAIVPIGYGSDFYPAQCLSGKFNSRTASAGNNSSFEYTSLAFAFRAGSVDRVGRLNRDGKKLLDFSYTFGSGEDDHEFVINPSLTGGLRWTLHLYRGSETQPVDQVLCAGTGQDHPAYRGVCWGLMENIDLGQGTTSIPNFELELLKSAPALHVDPFNNDMLFGVNPISAIYGLLTDMARASADLFDHDHWAAQAAALYNIGSGSRKNQIIYLHPSFRSSSSVADAIGTILDYFDGYLCFRDGKLQIGWFSGAVPDPAGLPEITEHDLDSASKPGGAGLGDWSRAGACVQVSFADWDRDDRSGMAQFQAPANGDSAPAAQMQKISRPFLHSTRQAAAVAADESLVANADTGIDIPVLRSRIVGLAGAPLDLGDQLVWNYAPHTRSLMCRITRIRIQPAKPSDVITASLEPGAFPLTYVAAADPRAPAAPTIDPREPYEPVPPADIAAYRLWFLPSGFGGDRQIAALIDRPAPQNAGTKLHLSVAGTEPWEQIQDIRTFAAKATVAIAIDGTVGALRISSTSLDFIRMQAQSALAQSDDELLLLIDDEVLSVGEITAAGGNLFDLTILRGRLGTAAAAHLQAAVGWLAYYDEILPVTHSEFYRVRTADVYDAALATKHFKFQARSTDGVENDPKPDNPGIAWQLPDLVETVSVGNFIDYIFKRAASQPSTPAGDGTPTDWFDAPPAANGTPLWMSMAEKTAGDVLVGAWSVPVQLDGTAGITAGANMIPYSQWESGASTGWALWNSLSQSEDFILNASGWFVPGVNTFGATIHGAISSGVIFAAYGSPNIPCTPGQNYQFSALVAQHRCDSIHARVEFYDSSGAEISSFDGNSTSGYSGGTSLSGFALSFGFATAPSNAATVRFMVFAYPTVGQSDPYIWVIHPWLSTATIGQTVVSPWSSTPMNGHDGGSISVEYSVDGSASWHSTFTAGDLYMHQRVGAGSWSSAIRIVGETGTAGADGNFIDHVFKRATTQPSTPTGNGLPSGWSDAPPTADGNPLWMSVAGKTAADVLVGAWSAPVQLDGTAGSAGASISVEYSVDGSTSWHSTFTAGDLYMHQKVGSGSWSSAIRIVGETGAAGASISVEYSVNGSTSWHSTFTAGDLYMHQKVGSGSWSSAIRIVGETGAAGADGGALLGSVTSSQTITAPGYVPFALANLALTVTTPNVLRAITFSGSMTPDAGLQLTVWIACDGTFISNSRISSSNAVIALSAGYTPSAGSHTFAVYAQTNIGANITVEGTLNV